MQPHHMDPHQSYRSVAYSKDLSYDFSSTNSSILESLLYPLKSNIGHSSNFPLSSQVESDTFSALSYSLEQHSSTETPSGKSPSDNSLESNCSFVPSHVNNVQDGLQAQSSGTPISFSSPSEMYALQKIENILMAPDVDETTNCNYNDHERKVARTRTWTQLKSQKVPPLDNHHDDLLSNNSKYQKLSHGPHQPEKCLGLMTQQSPQVSVRELLIECAKAISENRLGEFEILGERTRASVFINGDPMQRIGAYMLEGLVARKEASGTAIYRALKCQELEGSELLSNMQVLYEICPYFKFGYMAANGAIAEAVRNEDRVHIIDFQIAQGTQWMTLIQALAARPGGPPHVRITGVDDPVNKYARGGESLQAVGKRLRMMADKFKIPLEFHGLPVFATQVTREMLDIRPGEALAVNFTLLLHHVPDESVDVSNPRDGLLRLVKGLQPKVTTLVEQESNTNTAPFLQRFMETLDYYSAMFESIDVTLKRDSKDRISVEEQCLAKDIVNIIACEGKDRLERHELLGKWKARMTMAGFKPSPLSSYVNSVIKSLLACYSDKYTLVEKDGAMLLGWKDRNLISASAWR